MKMNQRMNAETQQKKDGGKSHKAIEKYSTI